MKLVPFIVVVPEKEMDPAMDVGIACEFRAKLATASTMLMVLMGIDFIFMFDF